MFYCVQGQLSVILIPTAIAWADICAASASIAQVGHRNIGSQIWTHKKSDLQISGICEIKFHRFTPAHKVQKSILTEQPYFFCILFHHHTLKINDIMKLRNYEIMKNELLFERQFYFVQKSTSLNRKAIWWFPWDYIKKILSEGLTNATVTHSYVEIWISSYCHTYFYTIENHTARVILLFWWI